MSANKPVSLTERIAACCPCRLGDAHCRMRRADDDRCTCQARYDTDGILSEGILCLWPGHALEAEAKAQDDTLFDAATALDDYRLRLHAEEARVEALVEVLSAVVASGLMRAIERLADAQVVDQEEMDVLRAIWKRAAALAERKP